MKTKACQIHAPRARCLFACVLTITGASVSLSQGTITYTSGENWTFPDFDPYREAYSGIYQQGATSSPGGSGGLVTQIGRTLDWASLNPAEDVYDFSYVDTVLAQAKNAVPSYGVIFRLKCSLLNGMEKGQADLQGDGENKSRMIPQWVLDKYDITSGNLSDPDIGYRDNDTFHTRTNKLYVAPWHAGVQKEYLKFVAEFGRRGYLRSPQLLGLYVHGVSSSDGEELDISESHPQHPSGQHTTSCEDWVEQADATVDSSEIYTSLVDAINGCFFQRLSAWKDAAGAFSYKLIWVGAGEFTDIEDLGVSYDRSVLNDAALGMGMGNRGGFIEHYYYTRIHPPKAEQSYDDQTHHVTVDWGVLNIPGYHSLLDGRFWGDENEETDEYDRRLDVNFTPEASVEKLLYRSSFFRAAATGMGFLWSGTAPISKAGGGDGLPGWFSRVAGKGPKHAPDAVAWLREAQVRMLNTPSASDSNAKPWRNMERFLYQRDDDSIAVASATLETPYVQLKKRTEPDESFSRRTNIALDHRKISFRLDPEFKASLKAQGDPVKIMVTYREEPESYQWMLRVAKGSGWISLGTVTTDAVIHPLEQTLSDEDREDRWKTATFTLPANQLATAFTAGSGLGGGAEFDIKLYQSATVDMHVRYVRVVRTNEPAIAPTVHTPPQSALVLPGQTVTLSVAAKGPGLTYQWKRNTVAVPGATGRWLDCGYSDDGDYTVTVSNANGSVTSSVATVTQAYNLVLDNFNDGNEAPWAAEPSSAGITVDAEGTNPSPEGGTYLKVSYPSGGSDWRYARWLATPAAFGSAWSASGANAIRFYLKGSHPGIPHSELRFQLREGDGGERWSASIGNFAQSGAWTLVTIPFSILYLDPASPTVNGTFDLGAIDQIRFYHKGTSARVIRVDKVELIQL